MKKKCPLTGDHCYEHECEWYIQIHGIDPQTGEAMNKWGCTVAWLPVLLIENSQQQRQTGAAVESFRNEMVAGNKALEQQLADSNTLHIRRLMP